MRPASAGVQVIKGLVMLDTAPNLSISPEMLCFIIAKAREFDVKDVVTDPDDASNPTDSWSRGWNDR